MIRILSGGNHRLPVFSPSIKYRDWKSSLHLNKEKAEQTEKSTPRAVKGRSQGHPCLRNWRDSQADTENHNLTLKQKLPHRNLGRVV